jgi:hypothetical protein
MEDNINVNLKETGFEVGTGSGQRQVAGSCKRGNEPLDSM